MTTHKFEELDDDEVRERVLDALAPIERRLKAGRRPGTSTDMLSGHESRDTVGGSVNELRDLFGADEAELNADEDEIETKDTTGGDVTPGTEPI